MTQTDHDSLYIRFYDRPENITWRRAPVTTSQFVAHQIEQTTQVLGSVALRDSQDSMMYRVNTMVVCVTIMSYERPRNSLPSRSSDLHALKKAPTSHRMP